MTINSGTNIGAITYDSIQSTVTSVLSNYYGYLMASSAITTGSVIKASDWQHLYSDINHALVHQTGSPISFSNINTQSTLNHTFINGLATLATQIYNNKATVNSQQIVTGTVSSSTRTTNWGSTITMEVQYTWTDVAHAQEFFNQGGYISAFMSYDLVDSAPSTQTDLDWKTFINTASLYISQNPQIFDVNAYNNGGITAFTENKTIYGTSTSSTISVAYSLSNPYTLTASAIFTPQGNGLSIASYPIVKFTENYSTDATGGTYAIRPQIQKLQQLNLAGAGLVPVLNAGSISAVVIHQYNTGSVTVTLTNVGTGVAHISGLTFVPSTNSQLANTSLSISTTTIAVNASAVITLVVNTFGATQGTYYDSYINVTSDNANGTVIIPFTTVVNYPIFNVAVTPSSVTQTLTTGGTVTQYFVCDPLLTGTIASTALTNSSSSFIVSASQSILSTHQWVISAKFTPPAVTTVNDITGTYNDTITAYFTPTDSSQAQVVETIPITYNLDIVNKNLGSWISPLDKNNAVAGFSYDIIEGVKYLTIGFGLGEDGSTPLQYNMGTFPYAKPQSLGVTADQKFGNGVVLYPSTDYSSIFGFCSLLEWFGSWISQNGGYGYSASVDLTYTVNMPQSGFYWIAFSANSGSVYINGNPVISGYADVTKHISNVAYMNAGNNTVEIKVTGGATGAVYTYINSNTDSGGLASATSYGNSAFAVAISNVELNQFTPQIVNTAIGQRIYWTTVDAQRPGAFRYWQEVYRIPIVGASPGNPKVYKNGDYPIKLSDYALGKTYSAWCGSDANAGSMFIIVDDGYGNLTISWNPWTGVSNGVTTGLTSIDTTLLWTNLLPYYYTGVGTRYQNLSLAINGGTDTYFFLGFDALGGVRRCIQPFPYIITTTDPATGQKRSLLSSVLTALNIASTISTLFGAGGGALLVAGLGAIGLDSAAAYVAGATLVEGGLVFGTASTFAISAGGEAAVAAGAAGVGSASLVDTLITAGAGIFDAIASSGPIAAVLDTGFLCFTCNSQIKMADGSTKIISKIEIGDQIFNHNQTQINTVKFVINSVYTGKLYSPIANVSPFGSREHPLIINEELCSYDPSHTEQDYPWLGKSKLLEPIDTIEVVKQPLYNLLVDGDGTYTVNGLGTTSVLGDGGFIVKAFTHGLIKSDTVVEILRKYHDIGGILLYLFYKINKLLGKLV